jgi:hypothetical protein
MGQLIKFPTAFWSRICSQAARSGCSRHCTGDLIAAARLNRISDEHVASNAEHEDY